MTFAIKFRKIQEFKQQGWTPACPTGRPECNKKAITSESVTYLYLNIPCSSSSLIYPQQLCLYHSALPLFLLFVTHVVVFPGGCCSVTLLCLTFNPMHCSMPGFPVLDHLLEFAQTHVHWTDDAIQPSHPLSLPSPPG